MSMRSKKSLARLSWFGAGVLVSGSAMFMLASGVLQTKNLRPTNVDRTRFATTEYFVTQNEDGTVAYFWQLDVARGRTPGTEVLQADAFLLGAANVSTGGGLNQTDINRQSGFRNVFIQGITGTQVIDQRDPEDDDAESLPE